MIVLWTIFWILVGIVILLAALLTAPLNFSAQAGLDDEIASFEGLLSWAGRLIGFQVVATSGQPVQMSVRFGHWTRQLQGGKAKKQERRPGKFDLAWTRTARSYLDKQVLREVFRCLFRLERSLDLRLSFEGEVGFEDPDLTGYLAGLLAVLNPGQWECHLQPNFTKEVLRFQGSVQGRIVPAKLLWLTGCLLLSTPVRSIWWSQLKIRMSKYQSQKKEAVVND
ncbi:MAG: hypothetical protein ABSC17_09970 [Thermacetogeniaceae bacterium]